MKGSSLRNQVEMAAPEQLASHRQAIYRYIRGIVRDAAEAEDLTQETLLRAYSKLPSLEDPAKLVPWLYRIATNLCHDRFRQTAYRHRPQSLDAGLDEGDDPSPASAGADAGPRLDQLMEQKEMGDCVRGYLAELSDSYRAVILLHDVQGLTNPEIAAMLGVSLGAVKIRLHRARERLRRALGEGCTFQRDERDVYVCAPKASDASG